METIVRDANPEDLDKIVCLMQDLAAHEGLDPYLRATKQSLTDACFGVVPRIRLIVACQGAVIVGYASYILQYSPWSARDYLYLDDLFVVAEMRRSGIGSSLMRRIAAVAVQNQADVRWNVEIFNTNAHRFYRSLGAELRNRVFAYWSYDTLLIQQRSDETVEPTLSV